MVGLYEEMLFQMADAATEKAFFLDSLRSHADLPDLTGWAGNNW